MYGRATKNADRLRRRTTHGLCHTILSSCLRWNNSVIELTLWSLELQRWYLPVTVLPCWCVRYVYTRPKAGRPFRHQSLLSKLSALNRWRRIYDGWKCNTIFITCLLLVLSFLALWQLLASPIDRRCACVHPTVQWNCLAGYNVSSVCTFDTRSSNLETRPIDLPKVMAPSRSQTSSAIVFLSIARVRLLPMNV